MAHGTTTTMNSDILATILAKAYACVKIHANKVCVTNLGDYDLNWWIDEMNTGNTKKNQTLTSSTKSDAPGSTH